MIWDDSESRAINYRNIHPAEELLKSGVCCWRQSGSPLFSFSAHLRESSGIQFHWRVNPCRPLNCRYRCSDTNSVLETRIRAGVQAPISLAQVILMQTFPGKFLGRGGGGASRSTNSPLPRYVVNNQERCGVGRGRGVLGLHTLRHILWFS